MKTTHLLSVLFTVVLMLIAVSGCVSKAQYDQCQRQNEIVNGRLIALDAELQSRLNADEIWKQKVGTLEGLLSDHQKKVLLLQESLKLKQAELERLAELSKGVLPVELSDALALWAEKSGSDLVSYDPKTGIVRFKSDLVFASGSDEVRSNATTQIGTLSKILSSAIQQGFDIIIVGHTDNQPIRYSAAKHPTNWHLSVHRSIAVEKILAASGLNETHIGVMGLGEFHPIEPNSPSGNPKNRRVEIYIVPAGRVAGSVKLDDTVK